MSKGPEGRNKPGRPAPREIGLIAAAIKREFAGLISLDDFPNPDPTQREQKFLSRGLAALFARELTGCDSSAAAACVVDGFGDYGIDAVAIIEGSPRLWLIQSKWSDQGRASLTMDDALNMINGYRRIDQRQYDRLNDSYAVHIDRIQNVLDHPQAHVTLLTVVMGPARFSPNVVECFEDAKKEVNLFTEERPLDYEIYGMQDAWKIIVGDLTEEIPLAVKMTGWFQVNSPYDAFHGIVPAGEVAQWYEAHGVRLFAQNIRQTLGLTPVNSAIVTTLLEQPESCWYFNNGITMLCDKIDPILFSRTDPRSPVTLELTNVSIVNGAQTVATIHEAFTRNSGSIGGQVSVKVISTRDSPDDFGSAITKATNTQNRVEPRDFAALDPMQAILRKEFQLKIEKLYIYRRGEMEPPPDAGCSIVEAAYALVCAHSDTRLVVRVKARPDELWQEGSQGAYRRIFARPPDVQQIWRSVLLLRAIREALHSSETQRRGRAAAVAEHGDLLLAHIVFHGIGLDHLDDTDEDWHAFLEVIPEKIAEVLDRLIHHVDSVFGEYSFVRSTFGSEDRCRRLVSLVLRDLEESAPLPEIPVEYREAKRKQRRPNAVAVLVDAGRILEGTELVFSVGGEGEGEALRDWLAEDPRRTRATWVGQRGKSLLWAADNRRYSPTGLVKHMWRLAGWDSAPAAVQGTLRWSVPGQGTLVMLAEEVLQERDLDEL